MPNEKDPPEAEPKPSLSSEEVNSIFTAREKRLEARLDKLLEEKLGNFAAKLQPPAATVAPEADLPTGKETDVERLVAARVKEVEMRFSKKLEAEKAARDGERQARMRDEEKNALMGALEQAGVADPELRKAAFATLYHEEKRLTRGEGDALSFKVTRDGYVDNVPVVDGVKEWAASDTGKKFLPARQAQGSGNVAGRAAGRQPETRSEKKAAAEQVLAEFFGKGGTLE